MAPVLQCPDCGTKHPLAAVPDVGTFRCSGCGRHLKVPEFVPRTARSSAPPVAPAAPPPGPAAAAAPAPPPEPVPAPEPVAAAAPGTRALPVVEQSERPRAVPPRPLASAASFATVPLWMRFVLWVVAVPLSFLIVFAIARATGMFTSNQLSDVFLANDAGRFWPVIRLLPFVAFVTAGLVHGGVYALARRRGRRRARATSGSRSYRSR
jgi:hypothetical protein